MAHGLKVTMVKTSEDQPSHSQKSAKPFHKVQVGWEALLPPSSVLVILVRELEQRTAHRNQRVSNRLQRRKAHPRVFDHRNRYYRTMDLEPGLVLAETVQVGHLAVPAISQ